MSHGYKPQNAIDAREYDFFRASGVHRYESDYPERYVVTKTSKGWMVCEHCGREFRVWVTHDALWKRLPKRLHKALLCTGCFRRFA